MRNHETGKLSLTDIAKIDRPGRHSDGGGLYVQCQPGGSKSWLFRYVHKGHQSWMGLGPLDLDRLGDSVREARQRAQEARDKLAKGHDPLGERRAEKARQVAAVTGTLTFEEVARTYITTHEVEWKNSVHRHQWKQTLQTYAYPHMGKVAVADVKIEHVKLALQSIWRTKSETARRVRGRIEAILDYATAHGYRSGENPARIQVIRQLLGKGRPRVTHHAAVPWQDVPSLFRKIEARRDIPSLCLVWLILTATRSSEARFASWDEIDIANKVWTIPAHRMKSGVEHRVPLSEGALSVLDRVPRRQSTPYIFVAQRHTPVSDTAMRGILRLHGLKAGDASLHGFRSSLRDYCAEIGVAEDVAEACLAHTVSDKTVAAYKRTKFFEARVRVMDGWFAFLA